MRVKDESLRGQWLSFHPCEENLFVARETKIVTQKEVGASSQKTVKERERSDNAFCNLDLYSPFCLKPKLSLDVQVN